VKADRQIDPDATIFTLNPDLLIVDAGLRAGYGFGIEELVGSIKALTAWPLEEDAEIGVTTAADIRTYLKEGGAAAGAVGEVTAFLTLTKADLAAASLEPWEFSKRPYRLMARPIIALDADKRIVMPWWCEFSARTYLQYIGDGRLPVPYASLPAAVRNSLDEYRQRKNSELEARVQEQLRGLGFKTLGNMDEPTRIGLQELFGEIDVLAAREGDQRLWVVECKDPTEPYSPSEIRRTWDRFHGSDGWIEKLERKLADVAKDPKSVAGALGVALTAPEPVALMVTREDCVAGHARQPRVAFTTLDGLSETVLDA